MQIAAVLVISTVLIMPSIGALAQVLPNTPPLAVGQILFVDEDMILEITLTATDLNDDDLSYIIVEEPSHGSLSGIEANLTYTPVGNYSGPDSFSFKANDGIDDSNTAPVSITVTPINDQPIADSLLLSTDEDTAVEVTLTGSDVEDGSSLTYSVTVDPVNGSLLGVPPDLTYTPLGNFSGADSFKFTVMDSEDMESEEATVSITVNSVNNSPIADNQTISTDKDTPIPITLTATDPDGDQMIFSIVDIPANGALTGTAPEVVYTPSPEYVGSDSFTFTASDDTSTSNIGTVSIVVSATADIGPTVSAGSDQIVQEDSVVTLDGTVSDDTAGLTLEWTQLSGPSVDLSDASAEDPTFTAPSSSDNSVMVFQLNATDADGNHAADTVTITESGGNLPPIANAGTDQTVDERSTVTLNGSTSSDSDGNITAFAWTQMVGPSVTLSSETIVSPSFVAPNVDADIDLTFNLTVTDNGGATDSDLVTVTVENVPRRSGGGGGGGGGSSSGGVGGGSSVVITDNTAPTVTVSPPEGKYPANLLVTLRSNEVDTIIRYTTNGIDPTASSSEYTNPINLFADTTLKYFGMDSSGNSSPITTAVYDINITHMQDLEANGTGWGIYSTRPVMAEYVSSSSVLVGKYIDSITVDLKKSAGATGTAEIGIINPDLTMKKVFATLDISTLSDTRYLPNKFNLTGEIYLIEAGDRIGVKYTEGTSDGSYVSIMRDTSEADPFDGNNTYLSYYTTSWTNQTTYDLVMTLEYSGKNPLSMPASYFLLNPLSKIMVLGTSFFNAQGTSVLQGVVGEEIQLSTTLQNIQQNSQNYTHLVEILDETGVALDISVQAGNVGVGQSIIMDESWLPLDLGTYTVKTFVWDETGESPVPLSSVSERTILVI